MKNIFSFLLYALTCTAVACFMAAACTPAGSPGGTPAAPQKNQQEMSQATSIYDKDIKPLTPVECGRCHNSQFNWLREAGGRHRFDCVDCHEQFHTYNPRKANWDEIMPDCQNCHELVHGKNFADCMQCHKQPHAPRKIDFAELTQTAPGQGQKEVVLCAICHDAEGQEFIQNPSLHNTELNCQGCHAEKHGYIPSCLDCHDPHLEGQQFQDCLVCHSPHSASNIKQYPEDVPNRACGACHETPYANLQSNVTKHSSLHCATCHVSHGMIPACQDCHGRPHSEELLERFTACSDCHADPHNLAAGAEQ